MDDSPKDLLDRLKTDNYPASYIIKCALRLRNNLGAAESLLKIALDKHKASGEDQHEVYLFLTALYLNHRVDVKDLLKKLQDHSDPRLSILRGYNFYLQKSYQDSMHEFMKVNYKIGMNLCALALRDVKRVNASGNSLLVCCINSKKWPKDGVEMPTENKNFLYRLGLSDKFDNKDSLDVKLNNLEYNEEFIEYLKEKEQYFMYKAEIFYVIGKIYHKMGQTEKAREFYAKSIREDESFMPAFYNLCRISEKKVPTTQGYQTLEDYNALMDLKSGKIPVDLNSCSREIRRIASVCKGDNLSEMEKELENKNSIFNKVTLLNNIGILHKNSKAIEFLQKALNAEKDDLRKNYIKYNLGLKKKEINLLKESNLPEATDNISLLDFEQNEKLPEDSFLAGCFLTKKGDRLEKAKEFLGENSTDQDLIRKCFLGSIYAQEENLDIQKVFSVFSNSFYCMNNLAVAFARKGSFKKALGIYSQLESDLATGKFDDFKDQLYCNIGNVYFLTNNFSKALMYYEKSNLTTVESLQGLAEETRDVKVLERIIKKVEEVDKGALDFFYKRRTRIYESDISNNDDNHKKLKN